MGLIALQQALRIRFRHSLLQDMLATLVLLQPAQHLDGLGDWIYPLSNRILTHPPAHFFETTTALAFVPGIQGWLIEQLLDDSPVHDNFEAMLAYLENLPSDALPVQAALFDHSINFELIPPASPVTEFEVLNSYIQQIQAKRETYNRTPLSVSTETITGYLLNPELLKTGIIENLKTLWNTGYWEHDEESGLRWQHATDYHSRQHYETDLPAIFRTVTGRPIPRFIQNVSQRALRLEWFPSCYVGAYVVYNFYGDTLRISFNANLTPASHGESEKLVGLYPAFKAMADENRLHILGLVADEEYSVGDLADLLKLSQSTVSRHLTLLAKTGLVRVRPQGTIRYYRLNPDGLNEVIERLQTVLEK